MGQGFTSKPWIGNYDWCSYQINQCRLHIDKARTKAYYLTLPHISANCKCGNCQFFESKVIHVPNKFFDLLRLIEIDITKYSGKEPKDELCCIGQVRPGKIGYVGSYMAFGQIGKVSKQNAIKNNDDKVSKVFFNDAEFGKDTKASIEQVKDDIILFSFYIEVDKPE